MFFDYQPPAIQDVISALGALKYIQRPYGDNEGDPINSPAVFNFLSYENQQLVNRAWKITCEYVRKSGNTGVEPNWRAITELKKHGYPASLNISQYDQTRLAGYVKVGDWLLDLSD